MAFNVRGEAALSRIMSDSKGIAKKAFEGDSGKREGSTFTGSRLKREVF